MKNLRLRIKEDGSVYVSAPYGVSQKQIDEFVSSREEWIKEQREKLAATVPPSPAEISDGTAVTLFGNRYVISVVKAEGEAFIQDEKLVVPLSEGNPETAVLMFMAKECRRICTDLLKYYLERAGYTGAPVKMDLKYLKSRWGSYHRQKNLITFNLAMCKLPEKYINYIVAHEVTHIFVHNHSADFYKTGETIFENFLKTDRELNKIRVGGLFS